MSLDGGNSFTAHCAVDGRHSSKQVWIDLPACMSHDLSLALKRFTQNIYKNFTGRGITPRMLPAPTALCLESI